MNFIKLFGGIVVKLLEEEARCFSCVSLLGFGACLFFSMFSFPALL
jgi:hypothetical protein